MIYKGDIGTVIALDVGVDVSGAASVAILWKAPSGASGQWEGTANGEYVQFTTQSDSILEAGTWEFQAYVSNASGWTGHGKVVKVVVGDVIYTAP